MKKDTFQQTLFMAGLKVSVIGAIASIAGTCLGGKRELPVSRADKQPAVVTTVAENDVATDRDREETIATLKEIVAKMNLTAEQIEQLCRDYDLPRDLFEPAKTTDAEQAK